MDQQAMGYEKPDPPPVGIKTDPEQQPVADRHLDNSTVKNITWSGVTVTVKDRETKKPKKIVDDAAGAVQAGEFETFVCSSHIRSEMRVYIGVYTRMCIHGYMRPHMCTRYTHSYLYNIRMHTHTHVYTHSMDIYIQRFKRHPLPTRQS